MNTHVMGELKLQLSVHKKGEYPQSFNKLFKKKMNVSPLEFGQRFN